MYFELALGEAAATTSPGFVPRPAACVGAWQVTAGAPVPGRVLLHRWQRLAEREPTVAAGTHLPCDAALDRHEVAIYGASPAWKAARRELALPTGALYELRIQRVLNGHTAEAAQVMGESTLPLLQAMGGHVVGAFDLLLGAHRPRMATFLAWPDFAAQQAAWARLDVEPRFWRRRDEEQARLHRRLFGDEQALLLTALPGCEPQANFGVEA
ncbi:MAG: NIPSNAP family protein [Ramlibacter sp.]